MKRLKKFFHTLLFPGLAAVLISVPTAAVLLVYTFSQTAENSPVAYIAYLVSAYSLTIVCAYIVKVLIPNLRIALHRKKSVHRYLTDISFQTHISLCISLGMNLAFAAVKLFYGIWDRSVWFWTLAVYYFLLAVMRFLLLRYIRREGIGTDRAAEYRQYRLCGMILLGMNIALFGVVILVIVENQSFSYDGYLIYLVALYAFYAVITAIRDIVKFRHRHSPVLSASKAVKLSAALVSMLSLETAMLAQFGAKDGESFRLLMTGLAGCGVCLIILVMAVIMLYQSARQLKALQK